MSDPRERSARRKAAALALGLALGAAGLPGSASAQFFGWGGGGWSDGGGWNGLAPQDVRRSIAERGFRVLGPLRRNGGVFVADVIDGRGRHERLIVAAADAQILQRFLIDDGRRPAGVARGGDGAPAQGGADEPDRADLVPPADIPGGPRRPEPSRPRTAPQQFGDVGADEPGDPPRRAPPPIRTVRPQHPRVVERSPESDAGGREPGPVSATPLAPPAPRPAMVALPSAKAPAPRPQPAAAPPAPSVAAQGAAAPQKPAAGQGDAPVPRRSTDPLAIPGGGGADAKPVRSVSGSVTGAPAPAPAPSAAAAAPSVSAKPADVPVAPLD